MFCSSIFPSERSGSMFLFEFRLTNRISSWSITSSIDNKSSYCPVTADSSSSRNVMHSLIRPWILGTRSPSSSDCIRFFTLISKFNRCWAVTLLSAVTGQYDDLLSIEDVIDQELILFVSLNSNKNIEPVRSLGKMLLQNIQLTVGKRYEDKEDRRRQNRPIFSVVLDEFAPLGD